MYLHTYSNSFRQFPPGRFLSCQRKMDENLRVSKSSLLHQTRYWGGLQRAASVFTNITSIRAEIYKKRKPEIPVHAVQHEKFQSTPRFTAYLKRKMFLERQHYGEYAAWNAKTWISENQKIEYCSIIWVKQLTKPFNQMTKTLRHYH